MYKYFCRHSALISLSEEGQISWAGSLPDSREQSEERIPKCVNVE